MLVLARVYGKWESVSYSLYYCVEAPVQELDLYSCFTVDTMYSHVGGALTPYYEYNDDKGHTLEQELLHSSIVCGILWSKRRLKCFRVDMRIFDVIECN